jgi:hypothetical protein
MNMNYEFTGHDWLELGDALGIEVPEDLVPDEKEEFTPQEAYIRDAIYKEIDKVQRLIENDDYSDEYCDNFLQLCRNFLMAFTTVPSEEFVLFEAEGPTLRSYS